MNLQPKEVVRQNGRAIIVRFEVSGVEVSCRRGTRGVMMNKSKLGAQVYDPKELELPKKTLRELRKIAGGILYEKVQPESEPEHETTQSSLF